MLKKVFFSICILNLSLINVINGKAVAVNIDFNNYRNSISKDLAENLDKVIAFMGYSSKVSCEEFIRAVSYFSKNKNDIENNYNLIFNLDAKSFYKLIKEDLDFNFSDSFINVYSEKDFESVYNLRISFEYIGHHVLNGKDEAFNFEAYKSLELIDVLENMRLYIEEIYDYNNNLKTCKEFTLENGNKIDFNDVKKIYKFITTNIEAYKMGIFKDKNKCTSFLKGMIDLKSSLENVFYSDDKSNTVGKSISNFAKGFGTVFRGAVNGGIDGYVKQMMKHLLKKYNK